VIAAPCPPPRVPAPPQAVQRILRASTAVWRGRRNPGPPLPPLSGAGQPLATAGAAVPTGAAPRTRTTGAPPPEARLLTAGLRSAYSPRFTPDGATLVFLSQDAAVACGAHNGSVAIHALPWAGAAAASAALPRCVLPLVSRPAAPGAFPGAFPTPGQLARAPWLPDGRLVLASTWGAADALVAVSLADGSVERLTPPAAEQGNW